MRTPILVGFEPNHADHAPVRFGAVIARATRAPLMIAIVQSGPVATPGAPGAAPLPVAAIQEEGGPHVAIATPGQLHEQLTEDSTAAIEDIEAEVRAWGLDVDCVKLQSTSAARALHEAAEREHAGLLVAGSSRRGHRVLGGSTADRLLSGAPCAVAVTPPGWTEEAGVHVIGVGYVASEEGREALHSAAALARRADATLRLVTVVNDEQDRPGAEEQLREAIAELAADVRTETEVRTGDAAETLAGLSEDVDALVCGSRGYGPLRAALLGSVTRRVVAEAHCPVIVLPRGVKDSLEWLAAESPAAAAPV